MRVSTRKEEREREREREKERERERERKREREQIPTRRYQGRIPDYKMLVCLVGIYNSGS